MCSESQTYNVAKQKYMQPVYDFRTREKTNYKNPANWLSQLITRDSTYNAVKYYDEKALRIFEEDKQSDEEENFFDGSMYHEYLKLINREKKLPSQEKQKKQMASGSAQPYMI